MYILNRKILLNIIFGLILALIFKTIIHGYFVALIALIFLPIFTYGLFARIFLIIVSSAFSIILNLNANTVLKSIKTNNYRSHEAFTNPKSKIGSYEKNLNKKFLHLHGDLCELGVRTPAESNCEFWEGQRISEFRTDEYGFLNYQELDKAEHLLIGDSFLAFSGGDNLSESIAPLLSKLSKNKKYYQANHPGGFDKYLDRIKFLDNILYPRILPITIFVFEGNDLVNINKEKNDKNIEIYFSIKKVFNHFKQAKYTPANKLSFMHYVAFKTKYVPFINAVKVIDFNEKKLGFLINYINTSKNKNLVLPERAYDLKKYTSKRKVCLVFIPTKWSTFISNESTIIRHPFLKDQFKDLRSNGIEIIDLTTSFQEYTRETKNKYLFWTDDTHWNSNGMKYASKIISKNKNCY